MVREMLENGQFSSSDSAIRQGDKEWKKLGDFYPNIGNKINVASPVVSVITPKKNRKGLLFGCGGFLLVGLLVVSVLGFFVYRNMFPSDSLEDLPDTVSAGGSGNFKLETRYPPKGNIWGTETTFVGLYENESKTDTIIYMLTVYSDEETAKKNLQTQLDKTCQPGEKPIYFSFAENGKEFSQGATCAVPLYIRKDDKLVTIGGTGTKASIWIEFAENLPFNKGAKMERKK